ncbi:ferroxidase fet3 [Coemansia spiralis]|uniref:Ferroxidase fet3 n=1 Tax=Coemansia spiralis TaxID=417178 RepID=A0A9W8L5A0_9FUNG|nr:ferroxidase fet3 [Coemansia spiralis]
MLLLLGVLASAARVVINWDVGYVQVNRDGSSGSRRAIGVNGSLQIPPVFATKGGTLVLNVHNSLDVSTSIHAHGIFQNGTNFMDSPAMTVPSLYSTLMLDAPLYSNEAVYGPQTHAIVLKHLEYIELVIKNPSILLHPMHPHDHAFQIIEYDSIVNQSEPVLRYSTKCNAPMQRDTFVVPVNHYVKLRFRADNPGVWLLHCHMDVHFGMGMALTLIEAPDVLRRRPKVPETMLELCRAQGIRTEGNGAGNAGFDLAGLPTPPTIKP